MNFSLGNIFAGFLFGTIGFFLIRLGKREGNLRAAGIGVALCLYPYFFDNPYLLWGIGLGLCTLAYRCLQNG